jgi:hypothetical protein
MSAIGLYAVWRDQQFVYVGMAGRVSEAVFHGEHPGDADGDQHETDGNGTTFPQV